MKKIKFVSALLILFFTISMAGSAFAAPGVSMNIDVDKTEVNVGDTFTITITVTNTGDKDLSGITLDIPLNGLIFMNATTFNSSITYDPTTGTWPLNNIRSNKKVGPFKKLFLTVKVPSELSGKTINPSTTMRVPITYNESNGTKYSFTPTTTSVSTSIKVNETNSQNQTGNGSSSGSTASGTTPKKTMPADLNNKDNNFGTIPNTGQGNEGSSYEVFNNPPPKSETTPLAYYIVGIGAVTGLIVVGYFKGIFSGILK